MKDRNKNNKDNQPAFSLGKEERLCSKKIIDSLFSNGNSFLSFPLKIVYYPIQPAAAQKIQAAFTVSKRNFKLAVQRNQIKRLIREAYRLNKPILYKGLGEKHMAVFFIFIGKESPDFKLINTAMKKGLEKLIVEIDSNQKKNE